MWLCVFCVSAGVAVRVLCGYHDVALRAPSRTIRKQNTGGCSMTKLYRSIACTVVVAFAVLSTAAAQQYTTIDFPGAIATSLNGGPNPQDTDIGSYVDTSGVNHGFRLKRRVFTTIDPPGSTNTFPNWISPEGTIVGQYFDASNTSHGFVLAGGVYTTVDFPGAAGTALTSLNPSGQVSGFSCVVAACNTTTHSFLVSKKGVFTSFDPPSAISSLATTVIASGVVFGSYTDGGDVGHGYQRSNGTYTTIDFPGATFTFT